MACNVTRLRAAEAIIIEISNIPGFSMSYGADNHVWLLPKSFLPIILAKSLLPKWARPSSVNRPRRRWQIVRQTAIGRATPAHDHSPIVRHLARRPGDAKDCHAGGPETRKPHTSAKASYPQAVNCLKKARVLKFLPQAVVGWVRMSNRGPVAAETIVQFAPKPNVKSEAGDPIDRAAQAILGLLHRTAADAEAKISRLSE